MASAQRDGSPSESIENMDVDSFAGSPHKTFGASDPYDEPYIGSRPVKVLLCGKTEIESLNFRTTPSSTFGNLAHEMATVLDTQVTVLQVNHAHKTFWTVPDAEALLGNTCQTLHVVVDRSEPFILGTVRTAQSEYPIPIFAQQDSSSISVWQAIVTAQPSLNNAIKSIEDFDDSCGYIDIGGDTFDFTMLAEDLDLSEAFPTVFFITTNEVQDELLSTISPESIPPFIQLPYAHYKYVLGKASQLRCFRRQADHLLRSVLHILISFANSLNPLFDGETPDLDAAVETDNCLEELLPVVPQLTTGLKEILNLIEEIVEDLDDDEDLEDTEDQQAMKKHIKTVFNLLCGDFPGAVTVRHSYLEFQELVEQDENEMREGQEHMDDRMSTATQFRINMFDQMSGHSFMSRDGLARVPTHDLVHTVPNLTHGETFTSVISHQSTPQDRPRLVQIDHSSATRARINRLSYQEQKTVTFDGGNTVNSQLAVLNAIEQLTVSDSKNRIWSKGTRLALDGKQKAVYKCSDGRCEYQGPTAQKARQHFVACHVEGASWECQMVGCLRPPKYKFLDDLNNNHMAPDHDTDYCRGRGRSIPIATPNAGTSHHEAPKVSEHKTQSGSHGMNAGGNTWRAYKASGTGPLIMHLRPLNTPGRPEDYIRRRHYPSLPKSGIRRTMSADPISSSNEPLEEVSWEERIRAAEELLPPSGNLSYDYLDFGLIGVPSSDPTSHEPTGMDPNPFHDTGFSEYHARREDPRLPSTSYGPPLRNPYYSLPSTSYGALINPNQSSSFLRNDGNRSYPTLEAHQNLFTTHYPQSSVPPSRTEDGSYFGLNPRTSHRHLSTPPPEDQKS